MDPRKSVHDLYKLFDAVQLLEPQLESEIKEVKKMEKAILKPAIIKQHQSSKEFNLLFEHLDFVIDNRKYLLKRWKIVSSLMKEIEDFLPYIFKVTHQYSVSNLKELVPLAEQMIILTYIQRIILREGFKELAREREICMQLREYLGMTKS